MKLSELSNTNVYNYPDSEGTARSAVLQKSQEILNKIVTCGYVSAKLWVICSINSNFFL